MIVNVLTETICLFCFSALFLNNHRKIHFMTKTVSDLFNFYSKMEFWKTFIWNHVLLFLMDFKLLMSNNNTVISWTYWKPISKLPILSNFAKVLAIFTMGKNGNTLGFFFFFVVVVVVAVVVFCKTFNRIKRLVPRFIKVYLWLLIGRLIWQMQLTKRDKWIEQSETFPSDPSWSDCATGCLENQMIL